MAAIALHRLCRNAVGRDRLGHGRHIATEAALNGDTTWEGLLARANDGDAAAFAQFLTEVSPVLRRLIRSRGRGLPPDQDEDILQDVLLAVHLKRQTWRRDAPVRPWLYAVARYKVLMPFAAGAQRSICRSTISTMSWPPRRRPPPSPPAIPRPCWA
ncbi:MAG: hypothetical protein ACK41Y_14190 [Paracoccus hibiscisoli]|uniref:hypothetical protein n=1 Tax=Paracoccus hibiscisoli TaxID=2023261 RepID=UPI00391A63FC